MANDLPWTVEARLGNSSAMMYYHIAVPSPRFLRRTAREFKRLKSARTLAVVTGDNPEVVVGGPADKLEELVYRKVSKLRKLF